MKCGAFFATGEGQEGITKMAKDRNNQNGPTTNPKDEPTGDRNVKKIQSADERTERTHAHVHGGSGRRNGSDKNR
jgi:hypothetical protein